MASGIVESSQSGSEQQPQQPQQAARTRLVQRLLASSSSLPNFLHELIMVQAHVVAGTEAAAFVVEPGQEPGRFELRLAAHVRPDNSDDETRAAARDAFQQIIRPCVEQNKDGAVHIEGTEDGGESQYCLVTLLRAEGNTVAASAVITRSRDLPRARQRLELMAIVGGYFELFTLRRAGEQTRAIAQSHQHVLQLSTAVATADGFDSSAMNLCNELASRTGAARVSIGWMKGEHIKLKAISHSEQFDKKQELSVQLVKVMEECVDNEEIVQFDPNGQSTNTVTREAQALSRTQGGEIVLSLPLRRRDEIVGVMTLEFAPNTQLGQNVAQGLAVAADLLAPQLYDRYQNDRWLITKAGLSIQELGKKAIGPKYMLAKTVIALVLAALITLVLYKPMYHVKAPFTFVPDVKQSFSVPFDGALLREVYFKPSDDKIIEEGTVLLEFDTTELRKQQLSHEADATRAAIEASKYRTDPSKTAELMMALEQEKAARASADYYALMIERGKIRAPFRGKILSGDLMDKRGSVFRQGEPLMEFAKLDKLEARLSVPERDIQNVHVGSRGTLATNSEPGDDDYAFTVERIVPVGDTRENSNVFTVYVTLESSSGLWRPGMIGEARIEAGNKPLGWIWTHRFVDWVRLKLWI